MTDALVVVLLLVVFIACIGMGGISLKATIDQTSVSMYAGICITDWRRLIVVGEPGHWGGIVGFSSVGPWSHAKRWCDGGHPVRPCTDTWGSRRICSIGRSPGEGNERCRTVAVMPVTAPPSWE